MTPAISDLLALQAVDMRIRSLAQRIQMIPKEIQSRQKDQEEARAELKSRKENFNRFGLEIKKVESEIKQKQDDILKLQAKSTMIKKNDEYQAMLREVDSMKGVISDLETKEIGLLDQSGESEAAFKSVEKQFNAKMKAFEDEIKELQQLTVELKEEIVRLQESRKPLLAKVDADTITRYGRLLSSTPGEPVVKVDNGICGSCHLKIIPQTMREVGRGLAVCDNCSHLIYLE